MRTELSFQLECSKCGAMLEADVDPKKSRLYFESAQEAQSVLAIHPCGKCYAEARKPIKLIEDALSLIMQKEDQ